MKTYASVAALAVANLLLVIACWWFLNVPNGESVLGSSGVPPTVEAVSVPADRSVRVDIEIELANEPPLLSPNWSGMVTAVHVGRGAEVATGTRVVDIDGVTRIAAHQTVPFYRIIQMGAVGADVNALCKVLNILGYETPETDEFDSEVLAAVRKFAADLGVVEAKGISEFDPAWVIYLPYPALAIDEIDLMVGAPAPGAGTIILRPQPRVQSARAILSTDALSGATITRVELDGELVKVKSDGSLELSTQQAAVLAALEGVTGVEKATVKIPGLVNYGSDLVAVPASAVVAVPTNGNYCVVTMVDETLVARAVEVVGSELASSRTFVNGLASGTEVVVAPLANELRDKCLRTDLPTP